VYICIINFNFRNLGHKIVFVITKPVQVLGVGGFAPHPPPVQTSMGDSVPRLLTKSPILGSSKAGAVPALSLYEGVELIGERG